MTAVHVPPPIPVEWLELVALVAAAAMALVLSITIATVNSSPGARAAARRLRRGRRRALRAFAEAVARGDLEAADRAAAVALEPARRGDRADAALLGWDERKLFALPIDDVRRQFLDPSASAFWFPDVERVEAADHVDLLLGPRDPIRLTVVSEAWTPQQDGLSFTAACAAFQITGHLTLRAVVAGTSPAGEIRTAVEVWVHVETTDSPAGRVALARARTATRDGLGRMAAELNPI